MDLLNFKKELIWLDVDFSSKEDLFQKAGNYLYELGYVKESFADALSEREKNFPTGLPTEPYKVAIPHTDSIHVNKEAVMFIRPRKAVKFFNVGDDTDEIEAEMVFVLCIMEPQKQLEVLKALVEYLSDPETMNALKNGETEDELCFIKE